MPIHNGCHLHPLPQMHTQHLSPINRKTPSLHQSADVHYRQFSPQSSVLQNVSEVPPHSVGKLLSSCRFLFFRFGRTILTERHIPYAMIQILPVLKLLTDCPEFPVFCIMISSFRIRVRVSYGCCVSLPG